MDITDASHQSHPQVGIVNEAQNRIKEKNEHEEYLIDLRECVYHLSCQCVNWSSSLNFNRVV